jgi:hypothetical protein
MSGEEQKHPDVDIEKLDAVDLANNYGTMIDEDPITMKPVSTLENMDPETGDFIRPTTLKPPEENEKEDEDKSSSKKNRDRQRKISKQSTKEFVRQVITVYCL